MKLTLTKDKVIEGKVFHAGETLEVLEESRFIENWGKNLYQGTYDAIKEMIKGLQSPQSIGSTLGAVIGGAISQLKRESMITDNEIITIMASLQEEIRRQLPSLTR
jgi:vacuolar-type H+-ATPase subunit E/Vma4